MANPFDQFDTPASQRGGNPFDQFDVPTSIASDPAAGRLGGRAQTVKSAWVPPGAASLESSLRNGPGEQSAAVRRGLINGVPIVGPALLSGVDKGIAAVRALQNDTPYSEELRQVEGNSQRLAKENPGSTLAGEIGGGVLGTAAAVMAAPTAFGVGAGGLLGRTAMSALSGGLIGGADAGVRSGFDPDAMKLGGAIGGALGGAAPLAGRLIGGVFGGARAPAPGVDSAARIAAAEEFGIPLSRGQATGDIAQQAFEEAARNEARGAPAAALVRGFDTRQGAAIQAARENMARDLGGVAAPAGEVGEGIRSALQGRAASLKTAADDAYASAASKEAAIGMDAIGGLATKIADDLAREGIVLHPNYGTFGGAQSAMNILKRVSGFDGAPADAVAQSLSGLEAARKALIKVKPTNGEDYRAIKSIRQSFDGWMDDAIDRSLFSGDPTALADLKNARELWTQYKGLTSPPGGGPKGPAIAAKMLNGETTGEQAANWLLGVAGADQAGRSAAVAGYVRNILGKTSPEWEGLRQSAFTKMMEPKVGNGGPQAVSKSIFEFVDGQGAPLAKVLFSPEELGQMRRYAAVLRSTVTDPKAANPSKTGYEVARLLGANGAMSAITSAGGIGASYLSGDPKYLAIAALPLARNAASLSRGMAATRATPGAFARGAEVASRAPEAAAGTMADLFTRK